MAYGDVFDGEEHQGGLPCSADDGAGIEEHALGADMWKRVRDLEIVEGRVVREHRVQQVPQRGNIPLAIPHVVEPLRLRLQRCDLKARIKRPIGQEHVQPGVQHHERDPHGVHNAHGVEQGQAGHLLKHRGGDLVGFQRRHLLAEGEQVVKAWRSRLLVMIHNGSFSLCQLCRWGDASGEEYPWSMLEGWREGNRRGRALSLLLRSRWP